MSTAGTTRNVVLARLLREVGWSPEELARELNAYMHAHGRPERLNPKTPYKWRDSGVHPRQPWPTVVAVVLSETSRRTVMPAELGWRGQPDLMPADQGLIGLPWTSDGALRAMRTLTRAEHLGRRGFLTLLGAATTAAPLKWLVASQTHDMAHGRSGSRVPMTVVDDLDEAIVGVRRWDDQLGGGGGLLDLVHAHLTYVVRLLNEHRYTDTVGRRLHASAGELMRLAGWLSFDAGDHGRAQRYWTTALYAAHTAGDRALGANIVGFMSCQAKDLKPGHHNAVTLAETALAGYRGTSSRVAAILALRHAEALAGVGATATCRRMIDRAFDNLSTPGGGDPVWSYWMVEPQAHAQAGYCYLRLQDWPRARQHLQAALRHQGPSYSREGVLRQILLARTFLRQSAPDCEHALTLAGRAIDALQGSVDSPRCVGHLVDLVRDLHPYRRRTSVTSFIDRATGLMTASATPTRV